MNSLFIDLDEVLMLVPLFLIFFSHSLWGAGRIDHYNWDHKAKIYKMERNAWHVFYEYQFPLEVCTHTSEGWNAHLQYITYRAMKAWQIGWTKYLQKYMSAEQKKLLPKNLWTDCGTKARPDIIIKTADLGHKTAGENVDYWAISRFFILPPARQYIYLNLNLPKQSFWFQVTVIAHEIGHALGVPHQAQGLMNYDDANSIYYAHEVDLYTIVTFAEPYLEGIVQNECSRAYPCCWLRTGEKPPRICNKEWRDRQ